MSGEGSPWVVVFSGGSSSGKTTLAREFHRLLDEPAWLFVADDCFPVKQPSTTVREEGLEPAIVVFHRAIAQWVASGRNVIIDGALPGPDLQSACLNELKDFRTYIIAVTCSVEELRRRETQRPEARPLGWAEQSRRMNDSLPVSLHVDTTTSTPIDAAHQVLDWLVDAHDRKSPGRLAD